MLTAAISAGGSSCQTVTRISIAASAKLHARCSCGMRLEAGAIPRTAAQTRGLNAVLQGWPTEQQLLALMRTRPGEAIAYQVGAKRQMQSSVHMRTMCSVCQTALSSHARWAGCCAALNIHQNSYVLQDIEEDPSRLLSTGLFKSCRPVVFPPKRSGEFYPTFLRVTLQQKFSL